MSQIAVSSAPLRAFEGMLHTEAQKIMSALAASTVQFGKAVTYSPTVSVSDLPMSVQHYASGGVFAGIAAADVSVETIPNASYGGYLALAAVPVLRRGTVWVKTEDEVDDLSKSVFVKSTNPSGTSATVTDTTTYPVTTQAGLTEKVTVSGVAEQTVTFSTAIDIGNVTDTTSYPVSDQDTLTEKVTIDGGSEQTVTFAGTTTSNAHVATQMDAQLAGCSVAVVGGQVVITSDTTGPTSSVAIGTGTAGLTWGTPATVNTATGIAAEMNSQLTDCSVAVNTGQVEITTDASGATVTVAIGTGTAGLTWDTPVAGTGSTLVLGSFRATSGTGFIDLGAIASVSWIRGATIGGDYFGLLEINLP